MRQSGAVPRLLCMCSWIQTELFGNVDHLPRITQTGHWGWGQTYIDGGRSCRLGCFHHVSKVPNFTCQQLPCPHTVFPSVHWGHQWFSGASSILQYLFPLGYLLLKVCPMPCPITQLKIPFHMKIFTFLFFEESCSAIPCLLYNRPLLPRSSAHPCPAQRPLWLPLLSKSGQGH